MGERVEVEKNLAKVIIYPKVLVFGLIF